MLVVRAPVAGSILELPAQPGQQIDAGAAIAKLIRPGPLWVELQAARQQPRLKIGDRLQVANCSELRVIAISPEVNGASQSLQIRAEQLDRDPCLKVNAYVEARLLAPDRDAGQPCKSRIPGRARKHPRAGAEGP
ncbi:HlyD family efflux transporter periplasmic adaptor subunit [Massilia sp. DWR3-1-1]|uniref:HlyD family efflux transporter periplasmic adaptor subunit n=1 Tax=Massilia sp. DWR3-1-1 TaxID=2804559 RepID=UPI003CFAA4A2